MRELQGFEVQTAGMDEAFFWKVIAIQIKVCQSHSKLLSIKIRVSSFQTAHFMPCAHIAKESVIW